MSDEETRYKRFQKRKRNIYAKELEKLKPKVIKDATKYTRTRISVRDINLESEDKWIKED